MFKVLFTSVFYTLFALLVFNLLWFLIAATEAGNTALTYKDLIISILSGGGAYLCLRIGTWISDYNPTKPHLRRLD